MWNDLTNMDKKTRPTNKVHVWVKRDMERYSENHDMYGANTHRSKGQAQESQRDTSVRVNNTILNDVMHDKHKSNSNFQSMHV